MRLIFYNLWHNGDIHFTRSFIRDIMKKTKYDEYLYLHRNNYKLLQDIPNLKYDFINEYCIEWNIILRADNDLYVNVHIGNYDTLFDDDVDSESRTVSNSYYKFFSYLYQKLGIKIDSEESYVPIIDYSYFDTSNIDKFLIQNKGEKVLVCNGPNFSNQFGVINYVDLIDKLSDDYPWIQFLLSSKNELNKPNIFFTSDIIQQPGDLNEISYLSTHCDVILGVSSSPYVWCLVEKNLRNTDKIFICPSKKLRWVGWGTRTSCKYVWITKMEEIYSIVKEELKNLPSLNENDFNIRTEIDKIFIKPNKNITYEHDLNIYFYLGNDKKWEHIGFTSGQNIEFWYQPFFGYNSKIDKIRIEFRTTKKLIFSVIV